MKILTAQQIREADQYTITNEPISSLDLMERAARKCAEWLTRHYDSQKSLSIFCGLGNNGGDGLVIARYAIKHFRQVRVFIVRYGPGASADFEANYQRLLHPVPACQVREFHNEADFPFLPADELVIDCIFGSGLNRPIEEVTARLVDLVNHSGAEIVAIDIPSGLFAEDNSRANPVAIIRATHTLTFETPKLALVYDANYAFVGEWHLLPIGLHTGYISGAPASSYLLTAEMIKPLLKPRKKNAHKGTFGHALLVTGSHGKVGAAVLAARACLRTGAGLLTVHVPGCGYTVLQTSVPEAMTLTDADFNVISDVQEAGKYNAVGIGCGIGTEPPTRQALRQLLDAVKKPLVLDADALNILSLHRDWLDLLPEGSILTPHPKEFERLSGQVLDGYARHQVQVEMAVRYKICLVVKGAHTCIALPDGTSYFNTTGNPGMATGGSGDVLTGMLTSLLAQGYAPGEACKLGVFLHGLAGDLAAAHTSMPSLIAGDLVEHISSAYRHLSEAR